MIAWRIASFCLWGVCGDCRIGGRKGKGKGKGKGTVTVDQSVDSREDKSGCGYGSGLVHGATPNRVRLRSPNREFVSTKREKMCR